MNRERYESFRKTPLGREVHTLVCTVRWSLALIGFPVAFGWLFVDAAECARRWVYPDFDPGGRTAQAGGLFYVFCLLAGFCASGYVAYRVAAWVALGPRKRAPP